MVVRPEPFRSPRATRAQLRNRFQLTLEWGRFINRQWFM
jgi:hypothetical protein